MTRKKKSLKPKVLLSSGAYRLVCDSSGQYLLESCTGWDALGQKRWDNVGSESNPLGYSLLASDLGRAYTYQKKLAAARAARKKASE